MGGFYSNHGFWGIFINSPVLVASITPNQKLKDDWVLVQEECLDFGSPLEKSELNLFFSSRSRVSLLGGGAEVETEIDAGLRTEVRYSNCSYLSTSNFGNSGRTGPGCYLVPDCGVKFVNYLPFVDVSHILLFADPRLGF